MTSWFYRSRTCTGVKQSATWRERPGHVPASVRAVSDDNNRDLETQLVFLDETRSTGYSWLLTVTLTNTLVPVRLYEADPNTFKVLGAPPTSVGVVKQWSSDGGRLWRERGVLITRPTSVGDRGGDGGLGGAALWAHW
jgi:hypothetical protein